MKNNVIIVFLMELVQRYKQKSPKFFSILQTISVIVGLATGLPELLDFLGIKDSWFSVFESKTAAISAIISFLLTGLPVDEQAITKKEKQEAMPFTTAEKAPKPVKGE